MSTKKARWSKGPVLTACALLAVHELACSGGGTFTEQAADGSTPAASSGAAEDADDATIIVIPSGNPGDSGSPAGDGGAASPDSATPVDVDDAASGNASSGDASSTDASGDAAPAPCGAGHLVCSGTCIADDVTHCGACTTSCTAPTHATASCAVSGAQYSCGFACDTGYTHCSNSCFNVQTDPSNCGRCAHACVGGTCGTGKCGEWKVADITAGAVVLQGQSNGAYGHVDLATDGKNVVWVDSVNGILEAPLVGGAGGSTITLAPSSTNGGAGYGDLAMAHGTVVWTTWGTTATALWSAKDGVATSGQSVVALPSSANDVPSGMAIDASGLDAYFIDSRNDTNPAPTTPALYECVLADKTCMSLRPAPAPSDFSTPNVVAISGTKLFFTDSAAGNVWRADYSHSLVSAIESNQPGAAVLAVDATYVYWADITLADSATSTVASFAIYRTSQSTPGTPTTVVPRTNGGIWAMASDGTNLYFSVEAPAPNTGGLLEYVPADGSAAPKSLVDGQKALAIATGGGAVVWINGDNTLDAIAAP
jgi:hypothetical protein